MRRYAVLAVCLGVLCWGATAEAAERKGFFGFGRKQQTKAPQTAAPQVTPASSKVSKQAVPAPSSLRTPAAAKQLPESVPSVPPRSAQPNATPQNTTESPEPVVERIITDEAEMEHYLEDAGVVRPLEPPRVPAAPPSFRGGIPQVPATPPPLPYVPVIPPRAVTLPQTPPPIPQVPQRPPSPPQIPRIQRY